MADANLSAKIPLELKARVKAEADAFGKTLSAHVRDILEGNFRADDGEHVRELLAELTEAVETLSSRGGGGGHPEELTQLALEVSRMKEQLALLAAVQHEALRIIVYQGKLEPTDEDRETLERYLETVVKNFRGGGS